MVMKSLKVILCLSALQDEYQSEQVKAAKDAAQRLGLDLEVVDAANDSIRQCEHLLKAIQAPATTRPDALIVDPVGHAGMPQVARAAAQAGIGWVVLNRDVQYMAELRSECQAPAFTVTSDDVELGRIQGRQIAAFAPEGSSVLYLQGLMNSFVAQLRTMGMREATPQVIDIRIIRGDWTREGPLVR
jgi:ABC-type sugar transport system substrate-binding protein